MFALIMMWLPVPAVAWTDGHSVEAIQSALTTPIPESSLAAAREIDDKLLSQGTVEGTKVYLVTDARQTRLRALVARLLEGMGEDPSKWIVRVLDTDPRVQNAFVTGGKYIYVFTGLVDGAESDDELAFVLGHELGHSLLKHNLRRADDVSTTLANVATIAAALSKANARNNAILFSKAIASTYGRDDEREADTFGVAISWRAGFDPVKGADFFTRTQRAADKRKSDESAQLAAYRNEVVALQNKCGQYRHQWAIGTIPRTQSNANVINTACNQAATGSQAYNQAVLAAATSDASAASEQFLSSHPASQDRIGMIAAVADYFRGARSVESLSAFEQPFRVLTAMRNAESTLLKPRALQAASNAGVPSLVPPTPSITPRPGISERLRQLDDLRRSGLITEAEYAAKKQQLLDQL